MQTGIHVEGPKLTKEYLRVVDVLAKIAERAQKQGDRETAGKVVDALRAFGGTQNTNIANSNFSG